MTTQLTFGAIHDQLAQSVGGALRLASFYSQRSMMDLNKRAAGLLEEATNDCLAMLQRVREAVARENLGDFSTWNDEELIARYARLWAAGQHAASRVASLGTSGLASAELDDLRARLDLQKKAGAIIRRLKLTEEGNGPLTLAMELSKAGHKVPPALSVSLCMPDYMGRRGYFFLSNNSAEMRRLNLRIQQVEAKLTRIETAETSEDKSAARTVAGAQIIENVAQDRLQIIFEGKPSEAVRTIFKKGGYRWSPRNGAWQRQLTNNARYCLSHVTTQLEALDAT